MRCSSSPGARSHGLAEAVRADAILLLVELPADEAIAWLGEERLPLFDDLAARYHAAGRDDDARAVLATAARLGDRAAPLVRCRRLQRQLALGVWKPPADLTTLVQLEPACEPLATILECPPAGGLWAPVPADCDAHCVAEAAWQDILSCHNTRDPMLRIRVIFASAHRHRPTHGTSRAWRELARAMAQVSDATSTALVESALASAERAVTVEACLRARASRR